MKDFFLMHIPFVISGGLACIAFWAELAFLLILAIILFLPAWVVVLCHMDEPGEGEGTRWFV